MTPATGPYLSHSSSLLDLLASNSRHLLALSIVCGIVSGVSCIGLIYLINALLGAPSAVSDSRIGLFIGTLATAITSGLASEACLIRLGQGAMRSLQFDIIRRILATPLAALECIGSEKLYAAITDDVQALVNATQALPNLAINAGIVLGAFVYISLLSPQILALGLVALVIGVICFRKLVKNAISHLEHAREIGNSLFIHFRSATSGTKELKLNQHRRRIFLEDELEPTGRAHQMSNVNALTTYAIATQWGQLLFFGVIGLLILARDSSISPDTTTLTGSVMAIMFVMGPVGVILHTLPLFRRAEVAARQIANLQLSEPHDVPSDPTALEPEQPNQPAVVELSGLKYVYPSTTDHGFTLGPIDLTLKSHEIVFVIGGNGSGKSTLLKLATGLYAPQQGVIRCNGKPLVNDHDWEGYRQLFSVVFADFHLFERLPSEKGVHTDAIARGHLERLRLRQKVDVRNGRFSTLSLSQGQRKRLALLCAYLEDRPIYVFDEWAADQDPAFKDVFYHEILPDLRRRGKAVLVVTHDDRYFPIADRVIRLDAGTLVAA